MTENKVSQREVRKVGRPSKGDLAKARFLVLRLTPEEFTAIRHHFKTSTALREFVMKSIQEGKASSGVATSR